MAKHTYTGNPGYVYPFHPDPLNPGDTVDLTDDQLAEAGEDFQVKKTAPKPDAAASDNED